MKKTGKTIRCFAFSPYPEAGASFRYRILQYTDMMHREGIELQWYSFLDNYLYSIRRKGGALFYTQKLLLAMVASFRLLPAIIRAVHAHVVIVHREIFPLGPPVCEVILDRIGLPIIFDIDDATFHAPTAKMDQRRLFRDPDRIYKTVRLATAVTVGSPYLLEKLSPWNDNCLFLPTSIDTEIYSSSIRNVNPEPVIGWIGNWGNAVYLKELIPVFEKLAKKHRFVLKLVGGNDIYEICPRAVNVQYKLWRLEDEIKDVASFDIGIMPLAGGPYDLGKGGFKLIQYMGMGIPAVASPVGMNRQVIEHGVNGYLASGSDEWLKYMGLLLNSSDLRNNLGKQGRKKAENFYSKKVNGRKFIELLKEVIRKRYIY